MADFKRAYAIVRVNEGGYANNSNDRGGETYKGIARKFWGDWSGWPIIDSYKKHISSFEAALEKDKGLQDAVLAFYKQNFWNELSLDQVNDQAIADELFDTAVNMSTTTGATFLQRTLNVLNNRAKLYDDLLVDGKIGPKTIQVLNAHKSSTRVLKVLNCLQGAKYVAICENNPSQEEFMWGWMNRVAI
jgi:lysozyme family protein